MSLDVDGLCVDDSAWMMRALGVMMRQGPVVFMLLELHIA